MKRTEPSVNILYKTDYAPSWKYVPRSITIHHLNGHLGLVPRHRDAILRNTQTLSHAEDTRMDGRHDE